MPRVLDVSNSAAPGTVAAINEAAARLRAGGVVAFPTETVYGLGADTFNPEAIERIYRLKGRPADNPLIAHVLDVGQARHLTRRWDDRCDALAKRFWPGPLTLVLMRADRVPPEATADLPTIAVRSPRHAAARALLRAFGGPISAPSANRSGRISPTCAAHVAADFADAGDLLILDGGPCDVGIESTVLDMTQRPPAVLRPGSVTVAALCEELGEAAAAAPALQQGPSPGTSPFHYAPVTPAELVSDVQGRLKSLAAPAVAVCLDAGRVAPPHRAIPMPADAGAYAAELYDALRRADAMRCALIVIERPAAQGELWDAIRDRLRRATGRVTD